MMSVPKYIIMPSKNKRPPVIENSIESTKAKLTHFLDKRLKAQAEKLIYSAACEGDVARVVSYLDQGADVNVKDPHRRTPLHGAAKNGRHDVIQVLLDRGANINARKFYGRTALMLASSYGHTTTAQLLLDNGANVNDLDGYGSTALMMLFGDHIDIVKLLLERGAGICFRCQISGSTALHLAALQGFTSMVELLLVHHGADVHSQDRRGNSALHDASFRGEEGVVRVLLQHNADVNTKRNDGRTPLHLACDDHRLNIARLLLSLGADIALIDQVSRTPLDYVRNQIEKQELYEFAQLCPAECWRRRRNIVLLHYSQPASLSTAVRSLMQNKDVVRYIVGFI
jgi:ankyrin repeat protein